MPLSIRPGQTFLAILHPLSKNKAVFGQLVTRFAKPLFVVILSSKSRASSVDMRSLEFRLTATPDLQRIIDVWPELSRRSAQTHLPDHRWRLRVTCPTTAPNRALTPCHHNAHEARKHPPTATFAALWRQSGFWTPPSPAARETACQVAFRASRCSPDALSVVDAMVGSLVAHSPRCPCPNPQRPLPCAHGCARPAAQGAPNELTD